MNPLFKAPLHGLCCLPYSCLSYGSETESLPPYQVILSFANVSLNESLSPIWALNDEGARYRSQITLFQEGDSSIENDRYYLKIDCQGSGLVKIAGQHITIDWQESGTDVAHYFQTWIAALYLELNKVLCLHANALAFQDNAIAIIAPSGTGKTTLTSVLSQRGFALMTDDMIALHKTTQGYQIHPSWPVMRMWPDTLQGLQQGTGHRHQKVHEKFEKRTVNVNEENGLQFCKTPKKLQTIYLLNRFQDGQQESMPACEIVPITAAKAVMILLQNSILGSCYRALGVEIDRIKALTVLLDSVSFKQINYSSGKSHLYRLGEMIKDDVLLHSVETQR